MIRRFKDFVIMKVQKMIYYHHFIHGPKDRLRVGKEVQLLNATLNTRSGRIIIGDRVMFSHNVLVLTGFHDYNAPVGALRPTLPDAQRDITIGDETWIASGVIIVGPVKIGKNCVIGAGSVVVKDIPNGSIAVGNPARVLRTIKE